MSDEATAASEISEPEVSISTEILTRAFFRNYPRDAARKLETLQAKAAAQILASQPPALRQGVWINITPPAASQILPLTPDAVALELLAALDAGPCASLISRLEQQQCERYLSLMGQSQAQELRELLNYPPDCAGHMMDTGVLTFSKDITVAEAMAQLTQHPAIMRRRLYTLDSDFRLHGQVDLVDLVAAPASQTLAELSSSISEFVAALDPKEDVAEKLQKNTLDILPVIDVHHRILGIIRGANAIEALKENISADLQTMVGASADERALSSSLFAVKKRQPWLQINLLTGFLAASVVGLFESTIAQFTALAILMPIAAGQSGNTGAQALAVTMRGLTLREITIRHWFRVMIKEAGAGFINGIAVAITCGAGVYLWSQSMGLALVLSMAMIISMTIAGIAGALVPICLKKLGQDPAQSSSIILTTVTDIAGFMSFLGIATLLASMLV
ncbi:magnesium transporter [Dasania sp. GY-MA-18]|uniref:Magnesium transporter n=1 Tax=Dasania phycosphaerae TaxID=2950436 RepID=A0A9J6RH91_9GAMM|nr:MULTISPECIES: magnesium transporter [Dasania]MCR8921220.1 magnesium transporter [Dasania sp. GY-MA-18]MCZ0863648.1 magnesium transporter [Dasania phycosphaerae]MCZ0867376.1 magnesium transporter [Dasania phycosphaerae]